MATTTGAITGRNAAIAVAGHDVSGKSNKVTLNPKKTVAPFNSFGDDWTRNLAMVQEWVGSARIVYSEIADEAMDLLYAAFESMEMISMQFQPKGISPDWLWTGDIHVSGVPIEVDRGAGIVVVEVPFVGNGLLAPGPGPIVQEEGEFDYLLQEEGALDYLFQETI